jgi:hypothetical protein
MSASPVDGHHGRPLDDRVAVDCTIELDADDPRRCHVEVEAADGADDLRVVARHDPAAFDL